MDLFKRWSNEFNTDSAYDNNCKSFKYKAKLLENTEADGMKEILRNAITAF